MFPQRRCMANPANAQQLTHMAGLLRRSGRVIEGSPGNLASAVHCAEWRALAFLSGTPALERSWGGMDPAALGSAPGPPASAEAASGGCARQQRSTQVPAPTPPAHSARE
eukprot:7992130-Pyramimonas_sp.AAC.2